MTAACAAKKLCGPACLRLIKEALSARGLFYDTVYDADALYGALLSDKKRASDDITLVIIRDIGRCERLNMPLAQAKEMLALGIKEANR